jgi:hypothetical protein
MVPPPLLPRGGRRGLLGEEGVSPAMPLVLTAVKVLPARSLWSMRRGVWWGGGEEGSAQKDVSEDTMM